MAPRNLHNASPVNTPHYYSRSLVSPSSLGTASSGAITPVNSKSSSHEPEEDGRNNEHHPLQSRHQETWSQRLSFVIQRLFYASKDDDDDETSNNRGRYYRMAAGILLTTIACAVCKHDKNGRNRQLLVVSSLLARWNTAALGSHNPTLKHRNSATIEILKRLCNKLFQLLKRPDYAYAEAASLGLLRSSAQQPGVVQKVLIGATEIIFHTKNGWKRTSLPPQSPGLKSDLIDLLTRKGGCSDIAALPDTFWEKASTPLIMAFPFVYLAFAYRVLKGLQNGSDDGGDFFSSKLLSLPKRRTNNDSSDSQMVTFSEIAGLDNILPEVKEIVSYLKHPEGFHALGAQPPRGILLHGSPGVGKTMIAKAIAGEASCDAFCVCSGSDFCEMYVGRGAGRVRSLFREARKKALQNYRRRNQSGWLWGRSDGQKSGVSRPATAILFIDELDAVAKSRSYGGLSNSNDERDQTLNQLLTEMDGFNNYHQDGDESVIVIVIAATNRAELLDPAILRRFDRQIQVPHPDKKGRMEILKVHASKTHCRFSTIHWEYLAEETPNFSGSDLKQVVNDAALLAVRQKSKRIEQGHLLQSIQRARAMKVQNRTGGTAGYASSMLPFVCRS
jgi:AAA+ superfamily predicted ATPase